MAAKPTDDRALRQELEDTQSQLKQAMRQITALEKRLRHSQETEESLKDLIYERWAEIGLLKKQLAVAGPRSQVAAHAREVLPQMQAALNLTMKRLEVLNDSLPGAPENVLACAKCGSENVAPMVRLLDTGKGSRDDLTAAVQAQDQWFGNFTTSPVSARVCGDCGYAELYLSMAPRVVAADLSNRKKPRR